MAAADKQSMIVDALHPHIGADNAAAAADVWLREYASLPGFGVVKFIQHVAGKHNLPDTAKRKLRLALFNQLYATDGDQAATPARPARGSAAAAGTGAPVGEAPATVAASLLLGICQRLPGDSRDDFLDGLRDIARETGKLDRPAMKALEDWDGRADPLLPSSETALKAVAHAAYLAACDAAGPAAADKALGEAVRRCEELPEAAHFPPRSLL